MSKTISMSMGRLAPLHDVRLDISANVDSRLTYRNSIFIDKLADYGYSIEAYTDAKFQDTIDEYNSKQTREDRKKKKSYTELLADENRKLIEKSRNNKEKGITTSMRKPTKLAHEYVLQIGDRISDGTLDLRTSIEAHRKVAYETLRKIQERYPHIDILLATFHADEPLGTPHMHLIVQFTGEGYKQGLSRQISMSKALELDGFERSNNRGNYAIVRWCEEVKDDIIEPKMKEIMHEEREELGEHRKHEDIRIFREKARKEEMAIQEKRDALEKRACEMSAKEDRLKKDMDALRDRERYIEAFSDRTSDMFNEAIELLEASKNIHKALSREQQSLYQKPLIKLNEQLMPHSQKTNDKQYSL